ncbi:stage II sporulation protein D [Lysinibacillus sp. SGAir0095]|uniref:stage II sporulation protein D n=1 Tax=Lysinibacillus sp. SGAir0095 TaxID=2070463 RepID=UPI0010CD3926|nr:stage II sporulation protein D [Lysinibacillus sp. SGAir0095]QCR31436.1 stage II sporulation protein D [Lysinibacillus sp. SGAir0095]
MKKIKNYKNPIMVVSVIGFVTALFFFPFLFMKSEQKSEAAPQTSSNVPQNACGLTIQVSGSDVPLDLEEYVIGVVAAEMPAGFNSEALKAQAIAARTYVLKSTNYGKTAIEPTVAKQVFYDEDSRKENWNDSYEDYEAKVREAVESTRGEVIEYNGELITAMFHSMSNGMTESSANYSGTELPYLQSVASTDFQYADNYETTTTLSIEDWNSKLTIQSTLADINQIRLQKNNTGRVEKVTMKNHEWTGRDFRTLLDLRSTDFQIKAQDGQVVITTEGYGHGVGMSQYGADAMADNGANAHEIIGHYYKNTSIEKINCEK